MAHGHRPRGHGRPPYLNPGRITRTAARAVATQSPGAGVWRERHERKHEYPRFCEALQIERSMHVGRELALRDRRGPRHEVYRCTAGRHHMLTGPAHWHVGRPMC